MTRKHYQLIASALSTVKPDTFDDTHRTVTDDAKATQYTECVESLINALEEDNIRFDRSRFRRACGFDC